MSKAHKTISSSSGKTILFGEHSVVYPTNPAVAISLSSLRITTTVKTKRCEGGRKGWFKVVLEDLGDGGIEITLNIVDVLNVAIGNDPSVKLTSVQNAAINKILEDEGLTKDDAVPFVPLLALMSGVLGDLVGMDETDVEVNVKSKLLPVGSGLGSSAAFCVSAAASLLGGRRKIVGGGGGAGEEEEEIVPGEEDLELINEWGYFGER